MESNHLHIRRLRARYLVSRDHLAPEKTKARIDDAIAPRVLAPALSAVLSAWFSQADESVWLIRRLDLEVSVNAAWDREHITRVIVMEIARMLGADLQDEQNAERILRFPNRTAYLARFLFDLANGTAWGRWYYESFSGLRLLSTSGALQTVIRDQPDLGQAALLQLADRELKKVMQVLTAQDARRILNTLAANTEAASEFLCCQAAWAAWRAIGAAAALDLQTEWRSILHLYLIAVRERPDAAGVNLQRGATALLRLSRRLAPASTEQRRRLLSALTGGDRASLYLTVGAADAEAFQPLLHCPPTWVDEVAQALIDSETVYAKEENDDAPGCRDTSFGGIFLLLPLLDELPLVAATRSWPHADQAAAITLVRLLLLAKCCGQPRAERAFFDPLLRDLLLIPPPITPGVIGDWQSGVTAAQMESFLATLTDWQRSRGAIRDQKQILASTNLDGYEFALLIDGARGQWLSAHAYSPRRPSELIETLRSSLAQLEDRDGILLCDPHLFTSLWSEFPTLKIVSFADSPAETPGEADQTGGSLARLEKLAGDLSHLALPNSFRVAPAFDLVLSVAAQQLLRSFAFRLPGFAESNLPYLWDNFLDFTGSLEDEPEHRVVRLSSPPLRLVLGMTGMTRQTYRLSWLDQRPLALYPGT